MKTYIKPVVEVKEFNVTNNIANLDEFLAGSAFTSSTYAGVITAENITSYTANS